MTPSDSTITTRPRLYYLDWLRVLSMLSVFLYHSNRFFDYGDWHVKNAQLSLASTIFENAVGLWLMPFLFTLSGAAVFYSLKSRSAGEFRKERFMRLIVPLLTLGMFVFGPWQIYLERLTHGDFNGTFWQFIAHYFEGLYGFGGNFAWMGVHLWYLLLLFIFSLIFLLLFLPRRKNGLSLISRVSTVFHRPWALFLLFIPLVLAMHLTDALDMGSTRQMGGWDIFSYMLFFIYGYLLFANSRIAETLRKYCLYSLCAVVVLTIFWFSMIFVILPTPHDGFFFKDELHIILSWIWILSFLGLGGRYLKANSRLLGYSNEAVLPFYVLHQPIILSTGYIVVTWNLPIAAKYFIISATSFITIMVIYELIVRRINVFRFLSGMRLIRTKRIAGAALVGTGKS